MWAPVDAIKQVVCRYAQRDAELGNRAHAWLTFATLDLCDVSHVEIGGVREAFLT